MEILPDRTTLEKPQRWLREFWEIARSQSVASAFGRLPRQARSIILTVLVGLGAGAITVAFHLAITAVERFGLGVLAEQSPATFLVGSFALVVGSALLAGWVLHHYCRDAAGSGIPQLKAAFWKDFGYVPARVIWVKYAVSALQVGSGSSLGREGPSVQIAGAAGSNIAGALGEPKQRRRLGAAAGAAAGLAAAFNTPLAAVTFVLEELIGDLNSRLLGSVLLAAMLGALVAHGILGPHPAFAVAPLGEATWIAYPLVPVVAALAALVGVAFHRSALRLRGSARGWSFLEPWMRPAAGAFICWLLGAAVFTYTGRLGVFGLGYADLSDALAGKLAWQLGLLLLAAKFIATVACYGTGGAGGVFSPTLFFGAMTGLGVAGMVQWLVPLPAGDTLILALVGMSAALGAVVRAPVTSILIVFEMTHQFALVPPLMLAALVSQAITRKLTRRNFYDALLEQDGHQLEKFSPPRDLKSWQEQPVSRLATRRAVVAASLDVADLSKLLASHPYERFPVVREGRLDGVLLRDDAARAVKAGTAPVLRPAVVCPPDAPLTEAERLLVESETGMIVLQETPAGPPLGLLTLHDILRTHQAAAENAE
jgi:CIC family chloride channel protein